MTDAHAFGGFSKVNLHIHHVQFDTQASDGVISGMSYEQSVRPFEAEDLQLASATSAGATTLDLSNPDPARPIRMEKIRPGVQIAIGQGTEDIEIRQVATVSGTTVTLTKALDKDKQKKARLLIVAHHLDKPYIKKALVTTDPAAKAKIYADAQQRIWKDAPWAFLVTEQLLSVRARNLTGFYVIPDGNVGTGSV